MDVQGNKLEQLIRDELASSRNLIAGQFQELKEVLSSLQLSQDECSQDPFEAYTVDDDPIGEGVDGVVYKVHDPTTNQALAMKVIPLNDNIITPRLAREISTLFDLKHKYLVKLHTVYFDKNGMYLVMELANTNLKEAINEGQNLPEKVKAWLKELLCVVDFLHKKGIIHRDIKTENILIDDNQNLKLADFGSIKGFIDDQELTPELASLQLMVPEVILGSSVYGRPIDIWAVGSVFFEMVEGHALFGSESKQASKNSVIREIFRKLGTPSAESRLRLLPNFPKDVSPSPAATELTSKLDKHGNDLMLKLLAVDPEDRICAEDALKHPYFSFGAY